MPIAKNDTLKKQYRGTVILESTDGILVTATSRGSYMLPGGRANRKHGESRLEAAVRELREETGLHAVLALELFEYKAPPFVTKNFQDYHKVFYVKVKVKEKPKPGDEVKYVDYFKPGMDKINGRDISKIHRNIIEMYYKMKQSNPELFKTLDDFSRSR